MTRAPKPLFDLLLALFPNNADLEIFLRNASYPGVVALVDDLPSVEKSRKVFVFSAVEQLQAYGLDTVIFDGLAAKFPLRGPYIAEARRTYLSPPASRSLGESAGGVAAGLDVLNDNSHHPEVQDALEPTRASLKALARDVDRLDVYKGLHDCLHNLQMVPMRRLFAAAGLLQPGMEAAGVLRRYEHEIRRALSRANGLNQLPEPAQRNAEQAWLGDLSTALDSYQAALGQCDAALTREALDEVRRILRYQPFRLNKQIHVTAHALPLGHLKSALTSVANVLDTEADAILLAVQYMDDLRSTLLASVDEHKMWQDADNKIWKADEAFESASPREAFMLIWREAKSSIDVILALDSNVDLSDQVADMAITVADRLADETASPDLLERAFGAYETTIRSRFRQLDSSLKTDCDALAGIGKTLQSILGSAA